MKCTSSTKKPQIIPHTFLQWRVSSPSFYFLNSQARVVTLWKKNELGYCFCWTIIGCYINMWLSKMKLLANSIPFQKVVSWKYCKFSPWLDPLNQFWVFLFWVLTFSGLKFISVNLRRFEWNKKYLQNGAFTQVSAILVLKSNIPFLFI